MILGLVGTAKRNFSKWKVSSERITAVLKLFSFSFKVLFKNSVNFTTFLKNSIDNLINYLNFDDEINFE